MKTRESCPPATESSDSMLPTFPSAASLAALRVWYEGLPARAAVARYLSDVKAEGESARSILSRIRRQLTAFARSRQQYDVAALFLLPITRQRQQADAVADAIELLASLPLPRPHLGDDIRHWFQPRSVAALRVYGIVTLADLTVRIPRRRRWWVAIPDLGHAGARRIEAFFRYIQNSPSGPERSWSRRRRRSLSHGKCCDCQKRLTVRVGAFVRHKKHARSTQRMTTRPFRRGCRCTKQLPRNAPIVRRRNA